MHYNKHHDTMVIHTYTHTQSHGPRQCSVHDSTAHRISFVPPYSFVLVCLYACLLHVCVCVATSSPAELLVCCGTFFIMRDVRRALGLLYPTDPFDMNEQTLTAPTSTSTSTSTPPTLAEHTGSKA